MPIYDKPTKTLMLEFAEEVLQQGQVFEKKDAVNWFKKNYPNIKYNTVEMHVEGMSVNAPSRKHHKNIRHGSGHDLFYKVGRGKYRIWIPETDPAPYYPNDPGHADVGQARSEIEYEDVEDDNESGVVSSEFAYEAHLRDYLAKNLGALTAGLVLYQDEDLTGVEFPVGGRYIDILAIDTEENFVVIELKVSKGYDRAIGQLLRYMAWVSENLANGRDVKGIVVANKVTEDLRLAASRIENVTLAEYEISFNVKPVG